MKISLYAKNIELTEPIRLYAEEKISALARFIGDSALIEARIELGKPSKHHHSGPIFYAEVNFRVAGKLIRANAEHYDLYAALDKVKDEVEVQIKKFKEKKKSASRQAK